MARRRVAARRPFARSICLIRHLLFVPAIGAVAVLAPQSAAAQDADAPLSGPAPDDTVTVGLGLAYVPDYEGSDDYRTAIGPGRSEAHTSELQSLMSTSYAVFCLNK